MKDRNKLPASLLLALGSFALLGSAALLGLINTVRWYAGLPPEIPFSSIPAGAHLIEVKLLMQFVACSCGFVAILFGHAKTGFNVACAALMVLLIMHLAGWPAMHRSVMANGDSPLLAHGIRLLMALWFGGLLAALVPNSSFKPKPLRGSA